MKHYRVPSFFSAPCAAKIVSVAVFVDERSGLKVEAASGSTWGKVVKIENNELGVMPNPSKDPNVKPEALLAR